MQRDKLDNNDSIMSNKESAKQSSSVMECDWGGGYTSMWLNHLNREEKVHDNRRKKIEYNQRQIFMNPELFGNNYNDKNSIKKNYLINKSVHGGYGNSLINDMTGCPIQKVHKLKEKKREKLKKYLYQGKQNNWYEYNKYKLQSGDKVSIELTPDYHFKRVLDPERQSYNNIIIDQIKQNSVKKQSEHDWNVQEEQKNQRWYERKMAKLQKKQEKHKEAAKQTFFHDIEFQLKQKQKYDRNLR